MITYTAGGKLQARARVGRDQRDRADHGAGAGDVQARLRGRLGQVQARLLEDVPQRVQGVHGPGARLEGDRLHRRPTARTGRCRRGSGCCRTTASRRRGSQGAWELRLSHWTGELPVLEIETDWAWHQWDHLFGTFTLRERPGLRLPVDVGRRAARHLRPERLRRHVRLGLRHGLEAREQLPDAHRAPARSVTRSTRTARHPAGKGTQYRATVEGPGVTPDVMWQGDPAGAYDKALDLETNARSRSSAIVSAARTDGCSRLARVAERGAEQRALFRRWPAGVSVVVAEVDGRRAGLTVSSLVSLSLEPPLVGISIALEASLHELLRDAGEWAASMLSGEQEHLAQHFARSVPPIALWNGIDVRDDDPRLLAGAAGWLIARTVDQVSTGDHTFFVGELQSIEEARAADVARLRPPGLHTRCDRRGRLRPRRRDRRLRAGVGRGARASTRARAAARTARRRRRAT